MAEISKPDYTYMWASGGEVVAPNLVKIQTGWTAEVPPYQWENYLQNRQDKMLVHINQHGIPQWDALTEYFAGKSYTLGSDGVVYKAVANSSPSTTTQDPTTDVSDTYWTVAFAEPGAFLTQTAGDARYTQRANNLSDLTNAVTARSNLGAAAINSPTFTGTPTAPTPATNTNTTQIATTAFLFQQFTGNQSLSANGYQRLPGGLIIQWGVAGSIASGVSIPITFPVAFSSACYAVVSVATDTNQYNVTAQAGSITVSGFNLRNNNAVTTLSSNWIAIGS